MQIDYDKQLFDTSALIRAVPTLTSKDLTRMEDQGFLDPLSRGEGRGRRRFYTLREVYMAAFVDWLSRATGQRRGLLDIVKGAFLSRGCVAYWEGEPKPAKQPLDWEDFEPNHIMILPRGEHYLGAPVVDIAEVVTQIKKYWTQSPFLIVPVGRIKLHVDMVLLPFAIEN